MKTTPIDLRSASRQGGAALVIGLILLLVLTILAVSGVNSASLEFIMAGNEQFRQNAFQAAETGIEQSIQLGAFNPNGAAQTFTGTNNTSDNYSVTVSPQLSGFPQPAVWGDSWNQFSTYHFVSQSTGTSARNSQAANTQGIMVRGPFDQRTAPGGGLGTAWN